MKRLFIAIVFLLSPIVSLAGGLDGRWVGDMGQTVVVKGSEWAYYEGSQLSDGGAIAYNQSVIRTQSAFNGSVTNYAYGFDGGYLYLQDPLGRVFRYSKATTGGGGGPRKCTSKFREDCWKLPVGITGPESPVLPLE